MPAAERGPFFSLDADFRVAEILDDARHELAKEAERRVQARLATSLRNPTGYYQSHVKTDSAAGVDTVNDSNVVYGPWLEGVGSRNATTPFKGYHAFRLAAQSADRQAGEIAQHSGRRIAEVLS